MNISRTASTRSNTGISESHFAKSYTLETKPLAPIIQLGCGLLLFHEPLPAAELVGFILVWIALALFTWDALANARRSRAEAIAEPAF